MVLKAGMVANAILGFGCVEPNLISTL